MYRDVFYDGMLGSYYGGILANFVEKGSLSSHQQDQVGFFWFIRQKNPWNKKVIENEMTCISNPINRNNKEDALWFTSLDLFVESRPMFIFLWNVRDMKNFFIGIGFYFYNQRALNDFFLQKSYSMKFLQNPSKPKETM